MVSRLRFLVLLGLCVQGSTSPAADGPWYRGTLVGMEVGPTGAQFGHSDLKDTRYCARFDGGAVVRAAVQAHCQYLVLWARDGDFAYYDSKLLPKAPGLGKRDPLREAVAEGKKHSLPVIAYCVVQQGGHYLKAHPEWEMKGPDGKPIGRFCFNSGYLEAMKGIVDEQLACGIDGFHIDMLDQGFGAPYGCYCDACRTLFKKEFGHDLPPGPTWDQAWDDMLEFRYRTSQRFEKGLAAHIKKVNPKATVDFNYHGNPPFSFEVGQRPVQHAGNSDFVTGETGVWGFSALGVSLNAEFYRAATPGEPFQVAMQRGVRMYHDQTTRPLNDMRWELLTLLSHGAFVTIVDKTGLTGALDSIAYNRIGEAFADALSLREQFGHKPVAEVGIYFSSRTRDWFGKDQPARYFQSVQGAQKACAYEHIPYGILLDENVSAEKLRAFPIVLLPNAAILSDREISLLHEYAEQGGNLILTGQPGQLDRLGKPVANPAISRLIGAEVDGALDSADNWVRLDRKPEGPLARLTDQIPHAAGSTGQGGEATPFLVKGPATAYEPTTAASYGTLHRPERTTRQKEGKEGTEWPMSPGDAVGPAVLLNRIGKGSVLTFAASPDFATASEHHVTEARKLLKNAVHLLNPTPRVEIKAPINVEAVVTDDPTTRTLRVHLLSYNSAPQTTPARERPYVLPALLEDLPLYRAEIKVSGPVEDVKSARKTTEVKRDGSQIRVLVNDVHEAIVIRYAEGVGG